MRPVRHGTLWLAVAKKPYSPENWNLVKRDLNKLSFIWDQTCIIRFIYDFSQISENSNLVLDMASGRSDDFPSSSDEEEDFFASFTVEEIGQIRQYRQRRWEQESLRDGNEEIDSLIDQQPQESPSNSDVEVFADDSNEESGESSNELLVM